MLMSRLPFRFIFAGLAGFIIFQLFTLVTFAGWLGDVPRSPSGWFHVHLLVLGWATMIAMGAVYQLISVVLQGNIYSERLGYVHFWTFLIGLAGLLVGFYSGQTACIAGFATLTFIGIMLFVWNLAVTLIRAKQWNPITACVASSLAYLLFTGVVGMTMGLNFAFGFAGVWHERLFGTHIWLGTIGWFGLLIVGMSFKLLPMFYLSHGYPERLQYVIFAVWNLGVLVGATSFLCEGGMLWKACGFALVTVAALFYNIHILQIYHKRHKKKPGAGVWWATLSAYWLTALGLVLCVMFVLSPQSVFMEKTILLVSWAYLWGWVALTILGYLSKIAPFLWWTFKYGPLVGKQKVPSMSDLINDRYVGIGMAAIAVCLLVLMSGIGGNWLEVARIGGAAMALCSFAYILLVARVFRR
jgi:hypothetical protein